MKITWFGTASILLETEKSRILFDPFVPMRGSKVQTTLSDYAGVDRIVATHGHFDHVRNIPALARQNPGLRVYCSETPCRSLQKAGTAAQVLVKIAPGDTVRIGDVSIDVYQGKHAALEGLNLSALLLPRVYRYCYCIPRLLLELLRYPEKKETLFFDVCTENKHIFHLGSMNLADEVDYPSGCDLLILPYASYRDNLAKADQMMNCPAAGSRSSSRNTGQFIPYKRENGGKPNWTRKKKKREARRPIPWALPRWARCCVNLLSPALWPCWWARSIILLTRFLSATASVSLATQPPMSPFR